MTIIIKIHGIPGSGKTYLCNKINKYANIKCFDTDDYISKAYNYLVKHDKHITDKNIIKIAHKILNHDINKYNIVVVVGITPKYDMSYLGLTKKTKNFSFFV